MDQLPVDVTNQDSIVLRPWRFSVRQLRLTVVNWASRFSDRSEFPIRFLAAGLLFSAAGLKYLHLTTTPLLPDDSGWQRWATIVQIEFEVFWGIWLLARIYSRFTRLASILLFVFFASISVYGGMMEHESCGCFGVVRVNPWVSFALDVLFAVAFLTLRAREDLVLRRSALRPLRLPTVLVVWALLGVPVAFFSSGPALAVVSEDGEISGEEQIILLDPNRWIGKRFPLTNHIDVGPIFTGGHWRLLFVRPGCPYCAEAVRQLLVDSPSKLKKDDTHWALVELPPLAANASALELPLHTDIPLGRLDNGKNWIANVPFTVSVADGTVVEWAPGILP